MPPLPVTTTCHPYRSSQSKPIASTSCCLSQILPSSRCPNISRKSLLSLDAIDARRHHHLPPVPLAAAQTDLLYLTPPHSDIVQYSLPQLSYLGHLRLLMPPLHATTTTCPPSPDASVARHHHHLPPVPLVAAQTNRLDLILPPSDIALLSLPKQLPHATSISRTPSPPLDARTASRRQCRSLLPHTASFRYRPPLVASAVSRAQPP